MLASVVLVFAVACSPCLAQPAAMPAPAACFAGHFPVAERSLASRVAGGHAIGIYPQWQPTLLAAFAVAGLPPSMVCMGFVPK